MPATNTFPEGAHEEKSVSKLPLKIRFAATGSANATKEAMRHGRRMARNAGGTNAMGGECGVMLNRPGEAVAQRNGGLAGGEGPEQRSRIRRGENLLHAPPSG